MAQPVAAADWQRLFATQGYRRLQERESALGRAFTDSSFQAFLLQDTLAAQEPALAATVASWRDLDLAGAARRALAYLPASTTIRATMYPMIKPRPNTFVYGPGADRGIFVYVDPSLSRAKLENTLAHELHHIGYATACAGAADSARAPAVQTARTWLGAFGEGVAMLAAAGGPGTHPHAVSSAEERARWDDDVADVGPDLRRVETFLLDVLDGRLSDPDSVQRTAMSFFGVQGPWYTVGWTMATTIETVYGRPHLVAALCDPPALLAAYNSAAEARNAATGAMLSLWSDALLARLGSH